MSTNKTQNFGLHAWESGDVFLRSEFNENFAALDDAARVVCGTYTGDGAAERVIELGFAPSAVLLCDQCGKMGYTVSYNATAGGIFLPECPVNGTSDGLAAETTENGFRVRHGGWNQTNAKNTRYHYIALR